MNDKDWILLTALHEERNITKTAKRLYLSQPALTYKIKQLEKEFHSQIITRGSKGIEFTAKGEMLVQYAQDMIQRQKKVKEQLDNMEKSVIGTLRLGVSATFARYILPSLLKDFLHIYPDVEINLKTGLSSEVQTMIQKDELHIGIIRGNYTGLGNKILYSKEQIMIVSHRPISLIDLPYLPRINYMTDLSLKQTIDDWWHFHYDIPPKISMETDRGDTCSKLVLSGLGYAILPEICIHEETGLHTIPLSVDKQFIHRDTWIVYRDAAMEYTPAEAFINFLHIHLKS